MKNTHILHRAFLPILLAVASTFAVERASAQQPPKSTTRILSHELNLRLTPSKHLLGGSDTFKARALVETNEVVFYLNRCFQVSEVSVDGQKAEFDANNAGGGVQQVTVKLPKALAAEATTAVSVSYEGAPYDDANAPQFGRQEILREPPLIIGEEGVVLKENGLWYPVSANGNMLKFKTTFTTPKSYEVVTQGARTARTENEDSVVTTWETKVAVRGLVLISNKFVVEEMKHGDIMLYTYFFDGEKDLAADYLKACARYMDMYEKMLGKYPYEKFAVVANFYPTGYGMASFTLLGNTVIRLPFIKDTSLGHEIAHNWFGNSVYVDYDRGNWCEGLTTYVSDYHYKRLEGPEAARDYRMGACKDYSLYIRDDNDFPLSKFVSRFETAQKTVGYDKTSMVFAMLELMLGAEKFSDGLKKFIADNSFKFARWEDLQAAFEAVSGEKLDWFFKQWVYEKGAPTFEFGKITSAKRGKGYKVTAVIKQNGTPFRMMIPAIVETEGGPVRKLVTLSKAEDTIEIETEKKPVAFKLDPEFEVFRRLHRREISPSMNMVFGDDKAILVLPSGADDDSLENYRNMAKQIERSRRARFKTKTDTDVTEEEMKNSALYIIGGPGENKLLEKLPLPKAVKIDKTSAKFQGKEFKGESISVALALRHPLNEDRAIIVYVGFGSDAISDAGHKIVHYGKLGYLAFDGEKNIAKGSWQVDESPLIFKF